MKNIKSVIALALVAGFASTSFAQGNATPTPAATPASKMTAPAPVAEKKVEAPKAAEPAKTEAAKATVVKDEAKPAAKMEKHHHKAKKANKAEIKKEAAPAPMAK
jgi:large subunit ribosomal protein L22e/colicin import membrane protein